MYDVWPRHERPVSTRARNMVCRLCGRVSTAGVAAAAAGSDAACADINVALPLVLAPALCMVGGAAAPTPVGGAGRAAMADAWGLEDVHFSACGDDIAVGGFLS